MTLLLGDAAAARIATNRFSPALVAAAAVAAIAIVAHPAWWTFVFVAFAIVLAVLDRRNARPSDVLRLSLALGGSAALGMTGLVLISVSEFISAYACPYDPTSCQGLGAPALYAGIATAIVGTMGFAATAWFLRQRARWHLVLPAVYVLLVGLFAVALFFGPGWGNAIVELGGMAASVGAISFTLDQPRLVRIAVVAQLADLGTFGTVWQLGAGEQNPLGHWAMAGLFGSPDTYGLWPWEAAAVTGVILILAKLGLIGFLIRVSANLGRYRRAVLLTATGAGMVGFAANVLVILR